MYQVKHGGCMTENAKRSVEHKNLMAFYRKKAGLTQSDLGELLGRCYTGIGHFERDIRTITLDFAREVVAAFNKKGVDCTVDDVFPSLK